ncbi:MAG: hypothetical protein ABIL86_01550 [candidate division WOR-3 bacterium]
MPFLLILIILLQSPTIKWARIYGGENRDYARSAIECQDHGFIGVGATNSYGNGRYDIFIFKVDSLGYPQWTKALGGSGDDYGSGICPVSENTYFIVGTTFSAGHDRGDILLLKINEAGDSIGARVYGDTAEEWGYGITPTLDNNYLLWGTTNSSGAGNQDIFLLKIDSTGEVIWSKTYGGSEDDYAYCGVATHNHGAILTGKTYSFGNGGSDIITLKINAQGEVEWMSLYGTYFDESGFCIQETLDSGYIVCGTAYFTLLGQEWCLLRYNQRGTLVWSRFQGSLNNDTAFSVQEIGNNNYILAGNFSYEMYTVRTDTAGLNLWTLIYGGPGTDCAYSIKKTSDDGYIIAGITNSYGAGDDNAYLVRTYPDQTGVEELSRKYPGSSNTFRIFPSPCRNTVRISGYLSNISNIVIYDIAGRRIKNFSLPKSEGFEWVWNCTDETGREVPSGIYFLFLGDTFKKSIIKY